MIDFIMHKSLGNNIKTCFKLSKLLYSAIFFFIFSAFFLTCTVRFVSWKVLGFDFAITAVKSSNTNMRRSTFHDFAITAIKSSKTNMRGSTFHDVIVVKKHKLLMVAIPKSGCTSLKMLLRRMSGKDDYMSMKDVHSYEKSGLDVWNDCSKSEKHEILNSPEWTRAVFVRNPKERLLSAFLNKVRDTSFAARRCCKQSSFRACQSFMEISFTNFFEIARLCDERHWANQASIIGTNILKKINFVGHLETIQNDTKRLLTKMKLYEKYGKDGWGKFRNQSIFSYKGNGQHHSTSAKEYLKEYYTPKLEKEVERYYEEDYKTKILGIDNIRIF